MDYFTFYDTSIYPQLRFTKNEPWDDPDPPPRPAPGSPSWFEPSPSIRDIRGEGRQLLCWQTTKELNEQKGMPDIDHKVEHVCWVRPEVIEPDNDAPSLTVEDALNLASLPVLKKICVKVLEDETTGAKFREELLSCTRDNLSEYKRDAIRERNAILQAGWVTSVGIVRRALLKDKFPLSYHPCSYVAWCVNLYPLFPRIKALHNRGLIVQGPELAWEALIGVTTLSIDPRKGDTFGVTIDGDGEEECDYFHEDVDWFMLFICKEQKKNGKVSWLQNGRRQEIWRLQEQAPDEGETYCEYRYQNTLKFLEEVCSAETLCKEDMAPEDQGIESEHR